MRKQARVLGFVAAASCCSPRARARPPHRLPPHRPPPARPRPRPPSARRPRARRPRRRPRRRRASGSSSSGPRRPSSPATSRPRSRATSTRRTSTSRSSTAARRSSRSRSARRPTAPSSRSPGSRRSSRPGSRAPTSSTSPRSSSAPARCRSPGRTSGLDDICKLAGKKVGVWDFGNEFEVTAGLGSNCGLTPGLEDNGDPATQYQKVIQDFNMVAFLNKEIDAAEAMIYNEYAQVLETDEPGDRRAVQARRPQHLRLERLPVVDAPGRDLRPRGVAQGGQQPRRRGPLRPGLAQGLDVLP